MTSLTALPEGRNRQLNSDTNREHLPAIRYNLFATCYVSDKSLFSLLNRFITVRDVLGYSAGEAAAILTVTEDSVTSAALKRARAAVRSDRVEPSAAAPSQPLARPGCSSPQPAHRIP